MHEGKDLLRRSAAVLLTHGALCGLIFLAAVLFGARPGPFALGIGLMGLWAAVNYLWMGRTVQQAVARQEAAAQLLRRSYTARSTAAMLVLLFGCVLGLPLAALILPLFTPRLAIYMLQLWRQGGLSHGT